MVINSNEGQPNLKPIEEFTQYEVAAIMAGFLLSHDPRWFEAYNPGEEELHPLSAALQPMLNEEDKTWSASAMLRMERSHWYYSKFFIADHGNMNSFERLLNGFNIPYLAELHFELFTHDKRPYNIIWRVNGDRAEDLDRYKVLLTYEEWSKLTDEQKFRRRVSN